MPVLSSPPLTRGPRSGVGTACGWPITSYFGTRPDPFTGRASGHGGEDIAAPAGTPILAVVDGSLWQGWDPSGGGNWSGLTSAATGDYYGYGHAARFAFGPGLHYVTAGTVIAWVGSTGKSTGAHLHFAYRPTGQVDYADPFTLIEHTDLLVSTPRPIEAAEDDDEPPFAVVPFSPHYDDEEDDMRTLGTDPRDGTVWEFWGLFKRWVKGPQEEIDLKALGVPHAGVVAEVIVDSRITVGPEPGKG